MSASIDHYDPPIQRQGFGQDLDYAVPCVGCAEDEDGFERGGDGHDWVDWGGGGGWMEMSV